MVFRRRVFFVVVYIFEKCGTQLLFLLSRNLLRNSECNPEMLYGEKGYREKCYIGRNVTEGEMLQGETLQGELLLGEMSWGETLYIRTCVLHG